MTYNLDSARRSVVTATAMALPQDAYDFECYEKRISDNWLLEKSVAMRTTRMPFLAVPVGGTGRGGGYPASCVCFGLKVCDFLLGRLGFPDLRVQCSSHPDTCFVVKWVRETTRARGRPHCHHPGALLRLQRSSHSGLHGAVPQVPLFGRARTVFPHGTVAGRRGPNFPPERTSTMCAHNPPCPTAMAPDREAARPVAHRPEQGWCVNCTFLRSLGTAMSDCPRSSV